MTGLDLLQLLLPYMQPRQCTQMVKQLKDSVPKVGTPHILVIIACG